jgi:hypothetical protein
MIIQRNEPRFYRLSPDPAPLVTRSDDGVAVGASHTPAKRRNRTSIKRGHSP